MSFILHGTPVSAGIAIGRAYIILAAAPNADHYLLDARQIEAEVARFRAALDTVQHELDTLRVELPADTPSEISAFLDVHRLILRDAMLVDATIQLIRVRRYNAEWALTEQLKHFRHHFDSVEDEYLRARKADIEQVVERLLKALAGLLPAAAPAGHDLMDGKRRDEMIIVASDIAPADMLQFKAQICRGFVTDLGARNSHTVIIARRLGIPAAVGVQQASALIRQDDLIIVDGDQGMVIIEPPVIVLEEYRRRQDEKARAQRQLQQLKSLPTQTANGAPILLCANIELPEDANAAFDIGAAGIGLFRTECLFMRHQRFLLEEEEQFNAYRRVVEAMKGRPVTIRTVDSGADKPLAAHAMPETAVANPALGLRAIRWCLSEPNIFLLQLRAILRASAFGPVKILIPMLAHAQQIDQTLALVNKAKRQCDQAQLAYDPEIKLGAMIEIPAAALVLPLFFKRLDFLAIGTNDLIQYTLAIDRSDSMVAHLYDCLHPAVLRLIARVSHSAKRANMPVSICGEMAGEPALTRLLLGLGLTEFSMRSGQLLAVKQEVLRADLPRLKKAAAEVLAACEPEALQAALHRLARA